MQQTFCRSSNRRRDRLGSFPSTNGRIARIHERCRTTTCEGQFSGDALFDSSRALSMDGRSSEGPQSSHRIKFDADKGSRTCGNDPTNNFRRLVSVSHSPWMEKGGAPVPGASARASARATTSTIATIATIASTIATIATTVNINITITSITTRDHSGSK